MRQWDEHRGDEYSHWGTATNFFEVAEDGFPTRQMEVYADGHVLQYSQQHIEDRFGKLADQALNLGEFSAFEIAAPEFEHASRFHRPNNR